MVKQGIELIKNIITSVLIIACIIIVLAVIFYDKISLIQVISESEDYVLTEKMSKELKDADLEETKEVIVNYYIDATDLKQYEKTNEYDKGKSNPFAAVEESTAENNQDTNTNNTSSTNNSSGNFYQDDGLK